MAMSPEGKLKDHLRKQLIKFCEAHELEHYYDLPSSSAFGKAGRPDVYLDIAHYHCRLEVKTIKGEYGAVKTGVVSALQEHYQERHREHHCHNTCVLWGKLGVADFIAHLPALLDGADMRAEYPSAI